MVRVDGEISHSASDMVVMAFSVETIVALRFFFFLFLVCVCGGEVVRDQSGLLLCLEYTTTFY